MKKSYDKNDKQVSLRPSTVYALKLVAEGKTVEEVADLLGRKPSNLYITMKRLRTEFPIISKLVDEIRSEGLLEKSSAKAIVKKQLERKVELAKLGYYMGSFHYGWKMMGKDPQEDKEQMKNVERIFAGIEEGKTYSEIGREVGLAASLVRAIAKNPMYKGEFIFLGTICRGNWKPPIEPERWNRVQRMLPPSGRTIPLFGYRW